MSEKAAAIEQAKDWLGSYPDIAKLNEQVKNNSSTFVVSRGFI